MFDFIATYVKMLIFSLMYKALSLLAVFFSLNGIAQDHVETEIIPSTYFDISIIEVFPDSFPKVTVMFQARDEWDQPLWLLDTSDLYVKENGIKCPAIAVRNISENQPINVGLVFDHSASMVDNPDQMEEGVETYQDLYFDDQLPEGYVMSIDYAKEAVLQFCSHDNVPTDSMFFVGFSKIVDKIPPLTNDLNSFQKTVEATKPSGNTAFYDALYAAIDSLIAHDSQPVVIALTDGQDNASKHTKKEVCEHAKENDVPIYIIGLGDVREGNLEDICYYTNGLYYHTNNPSQLNEIYFNIKKQIRSVYELDYQSSLDFSERPERNVRFYFTNDTLTFSNNTERFELPEEVMVRIEERHAKIKAEEEQIMADEQFEELLIYGAVAGVAMLGIAGFVVYRKRKKRAQIVLEDVFPNPFSNEVKITFISEVSQLELWMTNSTGVLVKKESLSGKSSPVSINLSSLDNGAYLFTLNGTAMVSNTVKVIKN